jgi:hypothetical protein
MTRIEIRDVSPDRARSAAVERNGGRPVYLSCVYFTDGPERRFVFRTSTTGGVA